MGAFAHTHARTHTHTHTHTHTQVSWEKLEKKEARFIQKHKQQLRNEIEAMKALKHVNVVRLLHHQVPVCVCVCTRARARVYTA